MLPLRHLSAGSGILLFKLLGDAAGDWEQAIEDAKYTVEFDPTAVTPWYRLGISLLLASLPSEAHQALEVALELKPG